MSAVCTFQFVTPKSHSKNARVKVPLESRVYMGYNEKK